MANEPKQNELRNASNGRIGSINHLRLTVTDIQRAERFYRPLMRFMEYELCDREEHRLAWAKWSSSGVLWLILTGARQDTKPARHDFALSGISSPGLERRMRLRQDLLNHQRVDIDHAVLNRCRASMLISWSSG
jgi:hypothetical protein